MFKCQKCKIKSHLSWQSSVSRRKFSTKIPGNGTLSSCVLGRPLTNIDRPCKKCPKWPSNRNCDYFVIGIDPASLVNKSTRKNECRTTIYLRIVVSENRHPFRPFVRNVYSHTSVKGSNDGACRGGSTQPKAPSRSPTWRLLEIQCELSKSCESSTNFALQWLADTNRLSVEAVRPRSKPQWYRWHCRRSSLSKARICAPKEIS